MEHKESSSTTGAPVDSEWLAARFAALESRNTRLRRWVLMLGLATSASMLAVGALAIGMRVSGAEQSRVITAEAFVLVDANGQSRGTFSLAEDGASQMTLQDRQGADRLRLTVRSEGSPGAAFVDSSGNRRIVLGLLPDETSTLVFADGGGSIRSVLGVSDGNRANLVFADKRGITRAGIGVDERGVASLMLPVVPMP